MQTSLLFLFARRISQILSLLLAPLLVAALIGLILAAPRQTHEVYRRLAQEVAVYLLDYNQWETHGWPYLRVLVLSLIGLAILVIALYAVSILLLAHFYSLHDPQTRAEERVLRWSPVAVAAIPVLSSICGLLKAQQGHTSPAVDPELLRQLLSAEVKDRWDRWDCWLLDAICDPIAQSFVGRLLDFSLNQALCYAMLLAILVSAPLLYLLSLDSKRRIRCAYAISRTDRIAFYGLIGICGLFAVATAIRWWSVPLPQWVGPLFIVAVFGVLLASAVGAASWAAHRTGLPITTVILLYVGGLAFFNLPDNHGIRYVNGKDEPARQGKEAALPELPEALQAWYTCRPNLESFAGRKYPVFIVAAQGGGIYAASHAAAVLAGLQDQIPDFRHHLLAVSGVSGGSVGGSVFASILHAKFPGANDEGRSRSSECTKLTENWPVRRDPRAPGGGFKLIKAVDDVFAHDMLSPLLAGMAFPDFLQRFIFVPLPWLDRARRLEWALEDAWQRELDYLYRSAKHGTPKPDNLLLRPYVEHWHPAESQPALLLNATNVGNGNRVVLSPFRFGKNGDLEFFPGDLINKVPLSSAAVLSARFPWITPTGWYVEGSGKSGRTVRLGDGAYFESSGIATALELRDAIMSTALREKLDIKIVALMLAPQQVNDRDDAAFRELGDPVRALLNTGVARALLSVRTAEARLGGSASSNNVCSPSFSGNLLPVVLEDWLYPFALGWYWSDTTYLTIRSQKGNVDNGAAMLASAGRTDIGKPLRPSKPLGADCVAYRIKADVMK